MPFDLPFESAAIRRARKSLEPWGGGTEPRSLLPETAPVWGESANWGIGDLEPTSRQVPYGHKDPWELSWEEEQGLVPTSPPPSPAVPTAEVQPAARIKDEPRETEQEYLERISPAFLGADQARQEELFGEDGALMATEIGMSPSEVKSHHEETLARIDAVNTQDLKLRNQSYRNERTSYNERRQQLRDAGIPEEDIDRYTELLHPDRSPMKAWDYAMEMGAV